MLTLVVWSILVTIVQLSFPVCSCENGYPLLKGRCDHYSGDVINCTDQLRQLLEYMKRLKSSLGIPTSMYSPMVVYSFYDVTKKKEALNRQMTFALKNVSALIKQTPSQYHYAGGTYCIDVTYLKQALKEWNDEPAPVIQWLDYYFPIIGGVELLFGILGNMLIVGAYIQNQDMKTGPNMVILNLAIGDMLLLIINIVMYYISYRWISMGLVDTFCRIVIYFRTLAIATSVYSMIVLSMLRFLAAASSPGSRSQHWMMKRAAVPMLLLIVWILAGVIGMLEYVHYHKLNLCEFGYALTPILTRLACLCLLPLTAIGCFSAATSRILHRSAQQIPGEQTVGVLCERRARRSGANVILGLVGVFCITYLPLNLYYVLNFCFSFHPVVLYYSNNRKSIYNYIFSVQLFIPLNSCLNPVALFIGSRKYRQYFRRCLLKCFTKDSSNVASGQQETELQVISRFSAITTENY